jgi:predicted nucleic acid-binding protein
LGGGAFRSHSRYACRHFGRNWFIRRLDLPLKAPDAIHIAIAQRVNAQLATFDQQMANAAGAVGHTVVTD